MTIRRLLALGVLLALMALAPGVQAGPGDDDCASGGGAAGCPSPALRNQSTPPDEPPITLPPAPDYVPVSVEVTQGMQDLQNSMPLVAGRWTVVRVSVRDVGGVGGEGLTGRLTARRLTTLSEGGPVSHNPPTVLTPSPLVPRNDGATIAVAASGTGDRRELGDWLWFRLPSSWTEPGEIEITAEVNPAPSGGGLGDLILAPMTALPETNRDNNTRAVRVTFWPSEPVRIRAIPLHLHQNWDVNQPPVIYDCNEPDFWNILGSSLRYVPAPNYHVACLATPLDPGFPHGVPVPAEIEPAEWDMSSEDECLLTNARMAWLRDQEQLPGTWQYVGLIDPALGGLCYGWSGAASSGTIWVSMRGNLVTDPAPRLPGGQTIGHEIGHRLGSPHVLCKGNEGPPNGSIDPDYPYPAPDCRFTRHAANGFYGLDVYAELVDPGGDPFIWDNGDPNVFFSPPEFRPLMGYLSPQITSPYSWCRYLNAVVTLGAFSCDPLTIDEPAGFQVAEADHLSHGHVHAAGELQTAQADTLVDPATAAEQVAALDAAALLLRVNGLADTRDGSGELVQVALEEAGNVYAHVLESQRSRLRGELPLGQPSDFRLQIRDAADAVLYEQQLLSDTSVHEGVPVFVFMETAPWPDGAARVVLLFGDTILDERTPTSAAPTVDVQFNPTEFAASRQVAWTMDHPDGLPLFATLRLCLDGGRRCEVLLLDQAVNSFDVPPLPDVPGGEAFWEVVVSDGFRTASAQSETFTLPSAAPQAVILSPADGETFAAGDVITFAGLGQDAEDGVITPGPALTWRSDREGPLGSGDLAMLSEQLTAGRHRLTLRVVDSSGLEGAASIEIEVSGGPESEPQTLVQRLEPGWHLLGWPGATPIEEATSTITGAYDAVFTFDATAQSFLRYGPDAPAFLNTLTDVAQGDGIWLHVTDAAGASWEMPVEPGAPALSLAAGDNLVAWLGADGVPTADALAAIADAVEIAFTWDSATQAFQSFSFDVPAALNSADSLDFGQGLWIRVSAPVTWVPRIE